MSEIIENAAPAAAPGVDAGVQPASEPAAPASPPVDDGPSLDDELSAKFDEITKTEEPTDEPGTPPRAPDGKFTKKEGEQEVSGKADEDGQKPGEGEGEEPDGTEKPVEQVPAPAHWSKETKEAFEALPPESRKVFAAQALAERQTISRLGQYAQEIKPVVDVVGKYNEVFTRHNVTPDQGLDRIMAVQEHLDRNPVTGIQHIAEIYGVDLSDMALDQQLGLGPDPQIGALQQEIAGLKAQLGQVYGNVQSQQEQYQQQQFEQQSQEILGDVNKFAEDKPDFDQLAPDILVEFDILERANPQMPRQEMLEKAYETARWRNPATREKAKADEAAAAEAQRLEAAKKAAQKARTANSINVAGNQSVTPTAVGLDDALSQKFDEIAARI